MIASQGKIEIPNAASGVSQLTLLTFIAGVMSHYPFGAIIPNAKIYGDFEGPLSPKKWVHCLGW